MPPGTHNTLTHSSWTALAGIFPADLESLEAKIAEDINGDLGGCWCPQYYTINITAANASPMTVSGPIVVWGPAGSLQMLGDAYYSIGANDFPALSLDHIARTQIRSQDMLAAMTAPPYASVIDTTKMGLQAIAASLTVSGATGPVFHVVPLYAHDGATLTGVKLNLAVNAPHTALPATMPTVQLLRCDYFGNVVPMTSVASGANGVGVYQLPAPATATAWYNSGLPQTFTIPVDQNNVVSNAQYMLYAVIADESLAGFPFTVPLVEADYATTAVLASGAFGTPSIDGTTIGPLNRVLVKDQSDPTQNGVYIAAPGAWTRAPDSKTAAQLGQGQLVYVRNGTVNANSIWQQETPNVQQVTGYPSWQASTVYKVGDGVCGFVGSPITVQGVASIALSSGGSGYVQAPAVTITGSCTSQCIAHAEMAYTVSATVVNLKGGSGYSSAPTVTSVGGGPGQSVTFTANLGAFETAVQGCTVTNEGSGYAPSASIDGETVFYSIPPTVSFTGGTAIRAATAIAVLGSNGGVVGVTMVDQGSYSAVPTAVVFTPVYNSGQFSGLPLGSVGGGTTATLTPVTTVASVTSLTFGSSTGNFSEMPTLVFSGGGGSGASAQAQLTGVVTDIVIDYPGDGYTATPSAAIGGSATLGTVTMNAGHTVFSQKPAPGLYFVATTVAGTATSGSVQPDWPTQAGQSILDNIGSNQILWTAQVDPGAQLIYGTTAQMPYNPLSNTLVAYGTTFISLDLTYSDIADCRWE